MTMHIHILLYAYACAHSREYVARVTSPNNATSLFMEIPNESRARVVAVKSFRSAYRHARGKGYTP